MFSEFPEKLRYDGAFLLKIMIMDLNIKNIVY